MDLAFIILDSLEQLWAHFMFWLPSFLASVIVFVLGLAVASALGRLVERLIDALKVDAVIEKMGAKPYFDRAGVKIDSGRLVGQLTFWFLTLAFLLAATDILGLFAVSESLRALLGYIPNVIVAALILLAAVLLANFLSRVTRATAAGAKLEAAPFVAAIVRWSVFLFGLFAALAQLRIAEDIINIMMTGLVAMLAIAGGLAFGLGGRVLAEDLLGRLRREVEE
jgi:hypothetical protein